MGSSTVRICPPVWALRWSSSAANVATSWADLTAVFAGSSGGTVIVSGTQAVAGLQFGTIQAALACQFQAGLQHVERDSGTVRALQQRGAKGANGQFQLTLLITVQADAVIRQGIVTVVGTFLLVAQPLFQLAASGGLDTLKGWYQVADQCQQLDGTE